MIMAFLCHRFAFFSFTFILRFGCAFFVRANAWFHTSLEARRMLVENNFYRKCWSEIDGERERRSTDTALFYLFMKQTSEKEFEWRLKAKHSSICTCEHWTYLCVVFIVRCVLFAVAGVACCCSVGFSVEWGRSGFRGADFSLAQRIRCVRCIVCCQGSKQRRQTESRSSFFSLLLFVCCLWNWATTISIGSHAENHCLVSLHRMKE